MCIRDRYMGFAMRASQDYLSFSTDLTILTLLEAHETIIFSDKVYKFNCYNWKQERNLVVTNKNLYNIKKKTMKRKILITNIKALIVSTSDQSKEFILHIPSEYDYHYTTPRRHEVIAILNAFHYVNNSQDLPLYGVNVVHLKGLVTKMSDKRKGRLNLPEKEFLASEMSEEARREMYTKLQIGDNANDCLIPKRVIAEPEDIKDAPVFSIACLKDFRPLKVIGMGGFATVYLVEKKDTKKLYAMKQIRKDTIIKRKMVATITSEKEVLKSIRHPFLANMEFAFQTLSHIYFVMKFYKGGELYQHLRIESKFTEAATRLYAAQILLALGELHKKNVVYRDLKPENILLDEDGYIALTDFGLSKVQRKEEVAATFCGTPEYMAPEMVQEQAYSRMVDWWGLGVLVYEMMLGESPFSSSNKFVVYTNILKKEANFGKCKTVVSEEAKSLITELLVKDPSKRLGAEGDMEEIKEHPFFKQIDFDKLQLKEIVMEYKGHKGYSALNFESSAKIKTKDDVLVESIDSSSMKIVKANKGLFTNFL
eukprot:TRINITY_DN1189_c0_g1_i18.p1 TRINITY_DN1189_c0_g1~~TRINITY_DN1189_c0_g1_i18.p1  ORF type:complete len:539 (+),score=134.93 TRINITY_DN1189_c0_g1_i18:73-1689(+)